MHAPDHTPRPDTPADRPAGPAWLAGIAPARWRPWLRALAVALAVGLVACAAQTALQVAGLSPAWLGTVFGTGVLMAMQLGVTAACLARAALDRRGRVAWSLLGVAVTLMGAADLVWTIYPDMVGPADVIYLASYVFIFAGLAALARSRVPTFTTAQWLDAAAAALALVALGLVVVLSPVAAQGGASLLEAVLNLAYPAMDLVLMVIVAGVFALTAWRPGRDWGLLGVAFAVLALADVWWTLAALSGSYDPGDLTDFAWILAFALVGAAALVRPRGEIVVRFDAWRALVVPAAVMLCAGGVLAVLALSESLRGLEAAAVGLALGSLALGLVRLGLVFRENLRLADARRQALTDPLTDLPNRRVLMDRLTRLTRDGAAAPAAVMLLDVDRFKDVNDALGHGTGDRLIEVVGQRLRREMRPGDTVARLGGDEFAVIAPGLGECQEALRVGRRLRAVIAEPVTLDGLTLYVEASLGVAMHPADGATPEELLQRADTAMYAAKSGRTGLEAYVAGHEAEGRRQLRLLSELPGAIAGGQVTLHFQPQVDLGSGAVPAVEALARWRHPELGLLPASEFVPLAERGPLIAQLTPHVLESALAQAERWEADGTPVRVCVNLSARHLHDRALPAQVAAALARHPMPPGRLELEVTETAVVANPERGARVMADLAALGVRLALDDFGVGQTSLRLLEDLPLHVVKIDRSFVAGLTRSAHDRAVVRAVVELARAFGLEVVGEGVEDPATLEALRELGCDMAQGYLLGRPVPPAAVDLAPPARAAAVI